MKNEIGNKIVRGLEEELYVERNIDFIGELFEKRAETIHIAITKNEEYEEYLEGLKEINNEIREKFNNSKEIIRMIEMYENAERKGSRLYEKVMYKYGMHDGIKLILEGTKEINIKKFLKENMN